ncbi:DUF4397 domain-containing protein [Ideonella livida]|uniref:DUF4397 domain-containing protein n=1 Tax=Ideonella livida TaxID=2707176 RepID=A0A7C9PJ33_9BURK|nr:DUF4397 domain-containing protein [Ideonella livida]NDY92949.1 DUF4397 domain-containing protein [Ideonella livida]
MKKRTLLGLMAATPLAMLTGCGSGDDSGTSRVRLLNASRGYGSLDLYVDDSKVSSATAFGTLSSYASIDDGSPEVVLRSAGSSTKLSTNSSIAFSSDVDYTVVAYGWSGSVSSAVIAHDEDTPDSGEVSLSILNTAYDAGLLDVYLSAEDEALDDLVPYEEAMRVKHAAAQTLDKGTYRLRVTKYGDKSDLRLDVSGITLADKSISTLVLVPAGEGAALVSALLVPHGGNTVTALANTQARVRAAVTVSDGAKVSLSLGGESLVSALKSSTIDVYQLVNAGTYTLTTTVDGTTLATQSVTLAAGTDTTLLVTGANAADAAVTVLSDDNRVSQATNRYRIRVVHAASSIADEAVTLKVSGSTVVTNQAYRSASAYSTKTSGTSLTVSIESQSFDVYNSDDEDIADNSVYTAIVWDKNGALTAEIFQDYEAVFS